MSLQGHNFFFKEKKMNANFLVIVQWFDDF